jgi:hypothetical protein
MTTVLPTRFAPAERAESDVLLKQASMFKGNPLVSLLDSVTDLIMILNSYRQIVYANRNLLHLLDMQDAREIIGMRPGELFSCEHAGCVPGGCGTSEFCRNCGAVKVIMCALGNGRTEDECRLTQRKGDAIYAYDLKVVGSPVFLEGERYVTFAITDMSHEKRRRALERIFFHDILNTAGGLRNLARMVLEEVPLNLKDETLLLHKFSSELVDEIMAQRVLLAAENEELSVDPQSLRPGEVLRTVCELYASHEVGEGRRISVEESLCDVAFISDPTLLKRVLANLVKNALEATPRGGEIRLGYFVGERELLFHVWNASVIPAESRSAIFQRSFSTKGVGRGLGTYSIKLLATNYLKGDVFFTTSETAGTRFTVRLPMNLAQLAAA